MLNKVTVIGNLGRDPEYRSAGQSQVANLSVGCTEKWKDRSSGELQEKTEWVSVVAWGRLAEILQKLNVGKGDLVYVEGSLETRKWQDRDGKDRYRTDVRALSVLLLRRAGGNRESSPLQNAALDDAIPF